MMLYIAPLSREVTGPIFGTGLFPCSGPCGNEDVTISATSASVTVIFNRFQWNWGGQH